MTTDPRTARRADTLQRHGISSVINWMSGFPNESYPDLGRRLGVMPIELLYWQFQEAIGSGMLAWAYIDSFVRTVRERLTDGWGGDDEETVRNRALCHAAWKLKVEVGLGILETPAEVDNFWSAVEQQSPPPSWVPQGIDDDIILRAAQATFGRCAP